MMARIGVVRALNRDRPVPEPGARRKRAKANKIIRALQYLPFGLQSPTG